MAKRDLKKMSTPTLRKELSNIVNELYDRLNKEVQDIEEEIIDTSNYMDDLTDELSRYAHIKEYCE